MDFSLTQDGHKPHPLDTRHLDIIPGGLAWLALILTLIGAIAAPAWLMIGTGALAAYMAARCLLASAAYLWGLHLIRQWVGCDWSAEYHERAEQDALPLKLVHHLVVIPNIHESPAVLRRSLDRLAAQANARTSITVVLAMEGVEPGAHEKGEVSVRGLPGIVRPRSGDDPSPRRGGVQIRQPGLGALPGETDHGG